MLAAAPRLPAGPVRPQLCALRRSWCMQTAPSRCRSQAAHASQGEVITDPSSLYFVAMNNFKVVPDMSEAFEERWTSRESHLKDSPGFKSFALLKCDTPGEYVSFSRWESRQHFEAWTKSQSFGKAHGEGKEGKGGPPKAQEAQKIMSERPVAKFYEAVTITEC